MRIHRIDKHTTITHVGDNERVQFPDGDWVCLCGNDAESEGFHPCDPAGSYRDPDEGWDGHYRCDRCGRVIDSDGYIITAHTARKGG